MRRGLRSSPPSGATNSVGQLAARSNTLLFGCRERGSQFTGGDEDGFRFRAHDGSNCREGAGGIVDSHVFQHVRCRLKGLFTNLVHAHRVPAVFTRHKSAACYASGRFIHALSLRFMDARAGGIGTATMDFGVWHLLSFTLPRSKLAHHSWKYRQAVVLSAIPFWMVG